jgi:pyruvate formate lyase activating enzyme
MGIKGFQGTSLLDFPGRIASLVFFGGCNLTCPFCHNPPLVLEPGALPDLDPAALLADLEQRSSFIDGVVVSGGEPTLDAGLGPFLSGVKERGLLVKLDTNGLAPDVVRELLNDRLIDYLAIDLKTSPARYPELHSHPVDPDDLLNTIRLAMATSIDIEFRTTCVPGWVDEEVIHELGGLIKGTRLWAIQQYHAEHALAEEARDQSPFSPDHVELLAEIARQYVEEVVVRGV